MTIHPPRFVFLFASCGLAAITVNSCDKSPEPAPHPRNAQSSKSPITAPTPNLDALASVSREVPGNWSLLAMNLYPLPAGLEFSSDAAPDEKPKLIAFLEGVQPTVHRAIEATKLNLEPFPPLPEPCDGDPEAVLRHPKSVMQSLARLLLADASRCVDAGDPNGALVRIRAAMRLASALAEHPALLIRLTGATILVQSGTKLGTIVDAAGGAGISSTAAAELRAELARFNNDDPAGLVSAWEREARRSVIECRDTYAVRGGPKKYAEYIRSSEPGLSEILSSMGGLAIDSGFADRAAALKPADINAALDRVEATIADIATAMRVGDRATLSGALEAAREDPTKIARLVVGGAPPVADSFRRARDAIQTARAAAERLAR